QPTLLGLPGRNWRASSHTFSASFSKRHSDLLLKLYYSWFWSKREILLFKSSKLPFWAPFSPTCYFAWGSVLLLEAYDVRNRNSTKQFRRSEAISCSLLAWVSLCLQYLVVEHKQTPKIHSRSV